MGSNDFIISDVVKGASARRAATSPGAGDLAESSVRCSHHPLGALLCRKTVLPTTRESVVPKFSGSSSAPRTWAWQEHHIIPSSASRTASGVSRSSTVSVNRRRSVHVAWHCRTHRRGRLPRRAATVIHGFHKPKILFAVGTQLFIGEILSAASWFPSTSTARAQNRAARATSWRTGALNVQLVELPAYAITGLL